jgi:mannobiose 2-epimerase
MIKVLRNELATELNFILRIWFPRTIDLEFGGFLSDFDYRWRPRGPQHKMLEYQARQTIAAAKGASRCNDLRDTALHGFRCLKEKLWDADSGGWFRLLDRGGKPLEGSTKHGHGSSYAISACVCCYELTAELACLELAKAAFAWLDKHAHDSRHGGYFVFYQRDGCPILANNKTGIDLKLRDAIGTPIGCKDSNTMSDLLKAFSDLYRVWPDALLKERLQELLHIVRDRLVVAPGLMHMYTHPDWTPLPDLVRYGQVVRSANHLLAAARALDGAVDPLTSSVAKSMVDMMVRAAWDKQKGGFALAGSGFGPINLENTTVFVRTKAWWPQADGIRALLEMAHLHPAEATNYVGLAEQLWQYIQGYMRDRRYGGWFAAGLDTNPEARKRPKASIWKDCSHEVEALHGCLSLLA